MNNKQIILIIVTVIISSVLGNFIQVLFSSPTDQAIIEERVITISKKLDKVIEQYATKNDLEQLDDRYKVDKAYSDLTNAKVSDALTKVQSQLGENTAAIRQLTYELKLLQQERRSRKR